MESHLTLRFGVNGECERLQSSCWLRELMSDVLLVRVFCRQVKASLLLRGALGIVK